MTQILIIEDDDILAEGVRLNLSLAGFQAVCASSLHRGRELLKSGEWGMILLDVNLPDGNGFEFAAEIRSRRNIPMIFLTAKDLDEDMMRGFSAGADDYVTKPFNVQILIQRIKAVLGRYNAGSADGNKMKAGSLEIDFDAWQITKNGKMLSLTRTEFRLLKKLCENPGIVVKRQVLLEELWDCDGRFVDEHTLTMFMSRLKKKISDEEHNYIRTVYGTGYQWIGQR